MSGRLLRLRDTERWVARVRLGAVVFAVFELTVFRDDYPHGYEAAAWATTAALAVGAVLLWRLCLRTLSAARARRLGLLALAFDTAVVSAGRWCAVDAASAALVAHCGAERFFALSGEANAVLATEEEARELTGRTGAAEAAALLAERYSLACVKRGPAGALAVLDGRVEEAAAPAVAGEALGAGDVFAATLLVGLARGDGLRAALSAACDAAARAAAS